MLNSAERYVSGFINSFIKACLPVSQVASKNLVLDCVCIRKSFFVSFFCAFVSTWIWFYSALITFSKRCIELYQKDF